MLVTLDAIQSPAALVQKTMKLTQTVIAGFIFTAALSISSFAAVANGSNASRAPLPMNQPFAYNRVVLVTTSATGAVQVKSSLIAAHIDGPAANQVVAV